MQRRRVLVVDDEPDIRDLLTMMLEDDGRCAEVRSVGDLDEVVPVAVEQAPDTVVLDLMFGRRTCVDVLPLLRVAAPNARILVFTSSRRTALDLGVLELGANVVVQKVSVSFDDLIDLVLSAPLDLADPLAVPRRRI